MDILSHGLWAVAAGKGARVESEKKLNYKWLFVWGIFPDLFAFLPIFAWRTIAWFGGEQFFNMPPGHFEPWTPSFDSLSNATQYLYQISHSFFTFIFVALLVCLVTKRMPWIMLGWPLHILSDIPTHSSIFYQTPALWPVLDWKFDGFQWGIGHFTFYNYLALAVVFALLYALSKWRKTRLHGQNNN